MRTIKPKSNGIGRYDEVSPFLVESGTLDLKIELPAKSGDFYLVTELNGKSGGAKLIPKDGVVVLDDLQAGELKAAVKHYLRGELIEVYKVEPLLLKAVDKSLAAMPEIGHLNAEIAALKEELATLQQNVQDNLAATQEGFEGMTDWRLESERAFLSFAYAVYENSPLLNGKGLSFKEFAALLGFDEVEEKTDIKEKL